MRPLNDSFPISEPVEPLSRNRDANMTQNEHVYAISFRYAPKAGLEMSPFQSSAKRLEIDENKQSRTFRQSPKWVNADWAQHVRSSSDLITIVVQDIETGIISCLLKQCGGRQQSVWLKTGFAILMLRKQMFVSLLCYSSSNAHQLVGLAATLSYYPVHE